MGLSVLLYIDIVTNESYLGLLNKKSVVCPNKIVLKLYFNSMNYITKKGVLQKACLSIVILFFLQLKGFSQVQNVPVNFRVDNLICEYKINPISVDAANPRLSWKLITDDRNIQQTAYEIRVGSNAVSLTKAKEVIWTSGKVLSDQSLHVYYGGPTLASRQKC